MLDDDLDLGMRRGPSVDPLHQPVERVVVGAHRDEDERAGHRGVGSLSLVAGGCGTTRGTARCGEVVM